MELGSQRERGERWRRENGVVAFWEGVGYLIVRVLLMDQRSKGN